MDASTSTIGLAVLEYDDGYVPSLIHQEYIKPNKKIDLIDMLIEVREYIISQIVSYLVDEVAIEDYVRSMHGHTTANTVQLLALLNMTLRIGIWDKLKIRVVPYNVLTVRHALKKGKELPNKDYMPEVVSEILGIEFPWETKINRRTKEEERREENYDVADAIAVGICHIRKKQNPVKKSSKKKSSKKRKKK